MIRKYLLSFILIFNYVSCQETKKEVALLGQWHLLSHQKTTDIQKSKGLPQYMNQKALYLILDEWIQRDKINLILAEGCESAEINQDYQTNFNGWSYQSLTQKLKSSDYQDILTLLPLKIEAKYQNKVKVICADSNQLIKKHQLIFSDIKGYTGFLSRLVEAKKKMNQKLFDLYHQNLNELKKQKIKDPILFCKNKVKELIREESNLIKQRNQYFLEALMKYPNYNPAIIIGHRHISDLQMNLKKGGYKVIIPEIIQTTLPKENLEKTFIDNIDKL